MLFMTWIARVGDGLPLAASIPEDEEVILIFLQCLLYFPILKFYLLFTVRKISLRIPESSKDAFP